MPQPVNVETQLFAEELPPGPISRLPIMVISHSGLLPSKSQSLRNQDRRGSGNSSQPALKTNGQETQLPLLEAKDICELASLYDVGGSLT